MKSIRDLLKIGFGPSSSHTMGPARAAIIIKESFPGATFFEVTLFNSLSATSNGHFSLKVLKEVLENVDFKFEQDSGKHPNYFTIKSFCDTVLLDESIFISIGGGDLIHNGKEISTDKCYKETTFDEIKKTLGKETLFDYIIKNEDSSFLEYLKEVFYAMMNSVDSGLNKRGVLEKKLNVMRKASHIYQKGNEYSDKTEKYQALIASYAFAVAEENASGGRIVTAPTCGASGVVPAVLYHLFNNLNYPYEKVIEGLAVAGLIGTIIKKNASISGAEAGCQAEIGSATAMAAAAIAYICGASIKQIEYASEVALEHSLGLTCDPVDGYVIIPCIERNAVFALRAFDSYRLSLLISDTSVVSLDTVIRTMLETGKDLISNYRETAIGGLAKFVNNKEE